jgi:hypothetical protein
MQAIAIGQAFDGLEVVPVGLDGQQQTRPHRLAVEQDGARSADAVLAAQVRPSQV